MNELLKKKLMESGLLTEETLSEIEAAVKAQIDEASIKAGEEATAKVTAELHEQWIAERETLIEALDEKVTEALASELNELHADIERFRDLEVEKNEQLAEAKQELSETLKSDLTTLIEQLDAFLEMRLTSELEEFREDVEVVKQNEFGRTVFEAFFSEFKKHYVDDDSVAAQLSETEQRLEDAQKALAEAEEQRAALERSIKLEKVLAPLSGRSREVMEAILKNIDTPMLEDAYKTYVGRVLKETVKPVNENTSEKEDKVLAEGKKEEVRGVVKNGDDVQQQKEEKTLTEGEKKVSASGLSDAARARLQRLAGLD